MRSFAILLATIAPAQWSPLGDAPQNGTSSCVIVAGEDVYAFGGSGESAQQGAYSERVIVSRPTATGRAWSVTPATSPDLSSRWQYWTDGHGGYLSAYRVGLCLSGAWFDGVIDERVEVRAWEMLPGAVPTFRAVTLTGATISPRHAYAACVDETRAYLHGGTPSPGSLATQDGGLYVIDRSAPGAWTVRRLAPTGDIPPHLTEHHLTCAGPLLVLHGGLRWQAWLPVNLGTWVAAIPPRAATSIRWVHVHTATPTDERATGAAWYDSSAAAVVRYGSGHRWGRWTSGRVEALPLGLGYWVQPLQTTPPHRYRCNVAALPGGRVIVWGGVRRGGVVGVELLRDTWTYRPFFSTLTTAR